MTFDSKDELQKIRRLLDTRTKVQVSKVSRGVPASLRQGPLMPVAQVGCGVKPV